MGVNLKVLDINGEDVAAKGMIDGSFMTAGWIQQMVLEGRVFCAQAGLLTTAITWTAIATNYQTKPALFLQGPDGTTILQLEISLYMEAFGTHAQL